MSTWRQHLVPIIVWFVAAGGAGWLFTHRAQRCELVGIAQCEERQVVALTNGRLSILPVQLYEQVKQGQTLAVLEDDKLQSELTSPMDGAVSKVSHDVGRIIKTGEPILTISALQPSEVIAYATPAQVGKLPVGTAVRLQVTRRGGIKSETQSKVIAASPTAEQVPRQLQRNPSIAEWGWPVKIALPAELQVLCGELVGVRGL